MSANRPSKTYPPKKLPGQLVSPSPKRFLPFVVVALVLVSAAVYVFLQSPAEKQKVATPAEAPVTRELSLVLGDMFVEPRTLSITQGDSLKLVVRNKGKVNHDLIFSNGRGIRQLRPGQEDTIDFGILEGSLTALCSLPGHSEAGMKFSIYVTEP